LAATARRQSESQTTADLLTTVLEDGASKVKAKSLSDEQVRGLFDASNPDTGGRLRDGYFMRLCTQAWVNMLQYVGIQNLDIPDVMLKDVDPSMFHQRGQYVANHIMRLVMGNVGRLTSAKIDWSVTPNTPDQIDREAAKVAQHVLDHLYEDQKLGKRRMEASLWLDITGTAFLYANWDKSRGELRRYYYDPMSRQPVAKQQLTPDQLAWLDQNGVFEEQADGDYDIEVLSLFNVLLPSGFTDLNRMPWVRIRRRMSVDEVYDRWPDTADTIGAEDMAVNASSQRYLERIPTLLNSPGATWVGPSNSTDIVNVDELWYVPSRRIPGGLYAAATKSTILEKGDHKFKEAGLTRRLPIVGLQNIPVPGRFHGMSTVEHMIQPQADYNRARQQMILQRDVLSVPQVIAQQGSLTKGRVRNEIGDVIEYAKNAPPPVLWNPPQIGQPQVVTANDAKSDLQLIASQSDASLGQMPQGARSGNAVAMLKSGDQQSIAPTVKLLEESYEDFGRLLLELTWKFQKLPRAVHVYGESRQSDVRFFKGSDLNGNCRVKVKAGSMTPKSKAENMELMQTLTQMGALNPAMDPRAQRVILEALDVGTSPLFALEDLQRRRARIENLMFAKPDPSPTAALPDVMTWDDHQAHYEEHLQFMLTDEYELMEPMMKQLLMAHLQKHTAAVAQMMEAQALVQGAGGGGEGGGGSPQAKPLGKPSPPSQNGPKEPNP